MISQHLHIPVLLKESVELLDPRGDKTIVDCTLGLGGHAEAILKLLGPKGRLIGIDRDEEALAIAKKNLSASKDRFTAVKGTFGDIKLILNNRGFEKADGILFDLGVSSMQIDSPARGFSLKSDGPLDMRMDMSQKLTAADVVNDLGAEELAQIIFEYGEERMSRKIARGIVKERDKERIDSTLKLADTVKRWTPPMNPEKKLAIITRVFQAIRIKVNGELDALKTALNDSIDLLDKGGRIVVISYHSLEDRIVKNMFRREATGCVCPPKQMKCTCDHGKKLAIITRKPVTPGDKEIGINPRSRSAKLRAAERI